VQQDDQEAVKWYRLAAVQGDTNAQYSLGLMYVNGEGVPQDYGEAVKWYRLAAEKGHVKAQLNLGAMYFTGAGVAESYEEAYAWWVVAAENGDEDARINMEVAQKKMTPEQIEKGQQIAKEIRAKLGN
jgi:TPR repeat protein